MFEEARYFSQGRSLNAFHSKYGTFGALICEDLWHVSVPYLLAIDGAQVLLALSASPTRLGDDGGEMETARINAEQHSVYARLLSLYLLFCNRTGIEDGVNFWGGSSVTGPQGVNAATAKYFSEDLLVCNIEPNEIQRARRFSRHVLDENPDLTVHTLHRIIRKNSGQSS